MIVTKIHGKSSKFKWNSCKIKFDIFIQKKILVHVVVSNVEDGMLNLNRSVNIAVDAGNQWLGQ